MNEALPPPPQTTVGGIILGQVVLGYIRRPVKHEPESKSASNIPA